MSRHGIVFLCARTAPLRTTLRALKGKPKFSMRALGNTTSSSDGKSVSLPSASPGMSCKSSDIGDAYSSHVDVRCWSTRTIAVVVTCKQ
eukprot:4997178-Prymnesium_polylepis.2